MNNTIPKVRFSLKKLFFLLFLCSSFVLAVFERFFDFFGHEELGKYASLCLIYFPFVLLCIKKRKILVPDFFFLFMFLSVLFLVTYSLHPEYSYVYERSDYGVLNYVLRPDCGIFIYLAIRLFDSPKELLRVYRTAGLIMYVFFAFRLFNYFRRGYWIDTSNFGYEIRMSYNLSFGYDVLPFALVFSYYALKEHNIIDIVFAAVGVLMIAIGGSRGPFLMIAIFFILYLLLYSKLNARLIIMIALALTALVIAYANLNEIVLFLKSKGINSRFLTKLLQGNIADTSTRMPIWKAAIEKIKANPLGYGPMGSRHFLLDYIYVAHCHNIFLELLVDFGVIFGSLIIIGIIVITLRMFLSKNIGDWKAVYLIFFSAGCQLMISGTFWHKYALWAFIAIFVQSNRAIPRRRFNKI